MLISPDTLKQHLNHPSLCFVVVGDEPLSQSECLDLIRHHARSLGAEERISYTIERHFNWQQVTQATQHFSLFSSHKILELHIPTGKPGIDGAKAISGLCTTEHSDTTLIIVLPSLDREAKNSTWYQTLMQTAIVVELKEVPPQQLPRWIAQRLATQQQSASTEALNFIAHQVEGNLLAAYQEIQKLGLLHPPGEIDTKAIHEAVLNVARFDAFQLGEAMLNGDTVRTIRILQGLQDEGEQAVSVMNPLIWLVRPLLRLKLAISRGESLQSAYAQARIYGDKQTLMKRALERLSMRQIEAALQKLTEIDRIAKGVLPGDAWLEISRLCFGLARIKANSR
jgi:DNA polymerase-3 subunit delta